MSANINYLHSGSIRATAQVLSYLLHPLWIPAAIASYLLLAHPMYALMVEEGLRVRWLVMVGINTILFPVLVAFLLWRLGFTKSLQLETQRERIFPLVINIVFYFWAWNVARNIENVPLPLIQWLMGVFLCSCSAMFMNIFMKISLHTLGMGGMVAFCILQSLTDPFMPGWLLPLGLILAGLTGTSRLLREAHHPGEVYAGYLAGMMCQVAGWYMAA